MLSLWASHLSSTELGNHSRMMNPLCWPLPASLDWCNNKRWCHRSDTLRPRSPEASSRWYAQAFRDRGSSACGTAVCAGPLRTRCATKSIPPTPFLRVLGPFEKSDELERGKKSKHSPLPLLGCLPITQRSAQSGWRHFLPGVLTFPGLAACGDKYNQTSSQG